MEKLYTLAEVADHLHICTRTAKRWMHDGLLQGSKIRNRVLFTAQDITTVLERHRTAAKAK